MIDTNTNKKNKKSDAKMTGDNNKKTKHKQHDTNKTERHYE